MTPTQRAWFATLSITGFLVAFACRSENGGTGCRTKAVASGALDGRQLDAAGRVALESAADAGESVAVTTTSAVTRGACGMGRGASTAWAPAGNAPIARHNALNTNLIH